MDDVEVQRTIASGAVEYLKGQPFNNVLLAVLITLVALAAGYGLPWAGPLTYVALPDIPSRCSAERHRGTVFWNYIVAWSNSSAVS